MKFKTYGSVLDSLYIDLKIARNQAHLWYYGTHSFFTNEALMVHRAYHDWCCINDIEDIVGVYQALKEYTNKYPDSRFTTWDILFNKLPDEFNVRGKWTPET